MYPFCYALLGLVLSMPVLAEDVQSHFTFAPEQTALMENPIEPGAPITERGIGTLEQTPAPMDKRNVGQRLLDMLGISQLVPHGSFSAFGLKARWALTVPDEETVALRVNAHW